MALTTYHLVPGCEWVGCKPSLREYLCHGVTFTLAGRVGLCRELLGEEVRRIEMYVAGGFFGTSFRILSITVYFLCSDTRIESGGRPDATAVD